MASEFLTKLGLKVASAAALGATTVALGAAPLSAASLPATPNVLYDSGTTLRVASDSDAIVADQQNQNQNKNAMGADKPAELADLA